jgi:O-acetyl-ADP-ribose deacetylase (regulator of RNase III)/uncharacterized protein YwgA
MTNRIEVREGNLFESSAQTLVNTVNCVGVMGKGIALEFRRRFPAMYRDYVQRCERREVRLGEPYLYRDLASAWVVNFPTKDHWRSVSRLDDIVAGLRYLVEQVPSWGVQSIAVPPLGCGNGGLEWSVVGPTLYRHLSALEIPVELYAPSGTAAAELTRGFLERDVQGGSSAPPATGLNPAWLALVEILARITEQPYHWPVGRIMLQKIAYFATVFGIPTGLTHRRGAYGPFAIELKPVLTRLSNNGLVVEHTRGAMLELTVGATWPDARTAFASEIDRWGQQIAFVADLMSRMTTHEAEMAATIHFVAAELAARGVPTESMVLGDVMRWKMNRRPAWKEGEVALMIRQLATLRVIDVRATDDLIITDESLPDDPATA